MTELARAEPDERATRRLGNLCVSVRGHGHLGTSAFVTSYQHFQHRSFFRRPSLAANQLYFMPDDSEELPRRCWDTRTPAEVLQVIQSQAVAGEVQLTYWVREA